MGAVVLASDGVWDALTSKDAVGCLSNASMGAVGCAYTLVASSHDGGSGDNMTAMVILPHFPDHQRQYQHNNNKNNAFA